MCTRALPGQVYPTMKVNEAKNKSAFLPRTTFPMSAERISESKATDAEIQLSLSCVLDCIYSLALTFCTGGVLYLTPTSTHVQPWHFKPKKKKKSLPPPFSQCSGKQ